MSEASQLKILCDCFFNIERKHDLDTMQISGVYFWKLLRLRLYYQLAQKKGIFGNPHPSTFKFNKLLGLWKALSNFPFCMGKNKTCFVGHSRKVNGKDMYLEKILSNFDNKYEIIEPFYSPTGFNTRYSLDIFKIIALSLSKIFKIRLAAKDRELIGKIEEDFQDNLGVMPDQLTKEVKERVSYHKILRTLYKFFLRWKKVKALYVVVGHSHHEFIQAAKNLGIPTFEIQHAILSPYHLGYHFPDWKQVPYVADTFLLFGSFWEKAVTHPPKMKMEVLGAPSVIKDLQERAPTAVKKKIIAVMSQGIVGEKLFKFAFDIAKSLPDYQVLFRLHPSEKEEDFKHLVSEKNNLPSNMRFSKDECSTYDLLLEAKYVFGVSSTTLYEAIVARAQPLIINLEGAEYMEPLYKNENIPLFETTKECTVYIQENHDIHPIDSSPFYSLR